MRIKHGRIELSNKYFYLELGRIPETECPGVFIMLLPRPGIYEEKDGLRTIVCRAWFSFSFLSGWRWPLMSSYWRTQPF